MSLDWFTVAAQIVNFLILVWLLKKFLYKPVLGAMEKREARIAARIKDATEARQAAEAEKDRYLALQEEEREYAAEGMRKAKQEAENYKRELMEQARAEVEANRRAWQTALEKEKLAFVSETSRVVVEQFGRFANLVFADLAGQNLEERIVEIFWRQMESLPEKDIDRMRDGVAAENVSVLLTTAFAVSDDQRRDMTERVCGLLKQDVDVLFEQDEELVAGVSLEAGGRKLSWNVRYFLDDFQNYLVATLERGTE